MNIITTSILLNWLNDLFVNSDAPYNIQIDSPSRNPSSLTWVAYLHNQYDTKKIFIKHHRKEAMYTREKHALKLLKPYSTSDELYAVPHLVAYNDNLRLIALDWLECRPVGKKLRATVSRIKKNRNLKDNGYQTAYKIGCWLRHFEQRTISNNNLPFQNEATYKRIQELNTLIQKTGLHGFDEQLIDDINSHIKQQLDEMNDTYRQSLLHRDFWFDHIWENEGRIIVIDYGRSIKGTVGRDAAQFFLRLDDLCFFNPLVSKIKVQRLKQEFIRGYAGLDMNAPHIKVYMFLCRLEQLGGLMTMAHSGVSAKLKARLYRQSYLTWLRENVYK